MKETYIKEFAEITPNNPVLIEGLPGLGLVGKIALRYLIKAAQTQKIRLPLQPTLPLLRTSQQKRQRTPPPRQLLLVPKPQRLRHHPIHRRQPKPNH